jgi:hypothetical protein
VRDELYMGNPTESDLRVARSLAAGWDGIILKRGRLEFTRALGCRRAVLLTEDAPKKSRFDGSVSRAVGQALAASRELPKWALGREARSDGLAGCLSALLPLGAALLYGSRTLKENSSAPRATCRGSIMTAY